MTACTYHVETFIQYCTTVGANFVDIAAMRWRALLQGTTWQRTDEVARQLHTAALRDDVVQVGRFLAGGTPGRFVVVSVAPRRGDFLLTRSFPDGDYVRFLLGERERFRQLPDFTKLDFVHWMLLWDRFGTDVHACYLWSSTLVSLAVGVQLQAAERAGQELQQVEWPPLLVPDELTDQARLVAAYQTMIRQELGGRQ